MTVPRPSVSPCLSIIEGKTNNFKLIYEPLHSVHVSGHASQDEMRLMIHMVKPKYFIPTHGEVRHLKQHAVIAEDAGIPSENIEVI